MSVFGKACRSRCAMVRSAVTTAAKTTAFVTLILLVGVGPLWAEGGIVSDEDALFGAADDTDELFGGGDLVTEVSEEEMGTFMEAALLTGDKIEIGGSYRLSLNSSWLWAGDEDWLFRPPDSKDLDVDLGADLFFDSRPSRDFRVFGKAAVSYSVTGEESEQAVNVRLKELFSDFNIDDKVFFRGGKQTINWGVGYFFSPADIINIGRIDPENPEAEREGPVALKANMPLGSNNLYLYTILDDAETLGDVALAPKAEFVLGGTEVGLGAYYRNSRAPRGMMTVSTSLGKFAVFGEGVISYGSDKRFAERVSGSPGDPLGVVAVKREDEYFFSGTAGLRCNYSDEDNRFNISVAGQYLYNGEGYEDPDFVKDNLMAIYGLVDQGNLSLTTDLASTGRHYLATSVGWSEMLGSDLSGNLFWMGNLSDGSGMVTASVSLNKWEHLQNSVGITTTYGSLGSELSPVGRSVMLFFRTSFGSGGF